ncbi:MAG: hypothetical protein SOV24_07770 [Muribaculaceae bacterium]|nr:hypothetical protein [Bacteroidales bacterium]MDY2734238.1 hypothetical protein [Muribaculaceae bacterium]
MILNLGSAIFNAETASGGGTPAWGTEMGQGDGYRFKFEDYESLITSLVYNSIPNPGTRIYCPLGKGGNQASDYEFVVASKFNKIFVNGNRVHDCSFILLVVKKLVGQNHVGRRTLKYNPRITLDNQNYNERCFELIGKTLGVSNNGSWFISEIYSKNQDELHFTAHILDKNNHYTFTDSQNRSKVLASKIKAYAEAKEENNLKRYADRVLPDEHLQQIYFGAPGTGKSFEIKQVCSQFENFRTTFHPDTDYAAFVGSYKPITIRVPRYTYMGDKAIAVKDELGKPIIDSKITYNFTFQAFLKAYIAAWKEQQNDEPKPVFLIIEEINRGNCAQIFGDIFQLLDRNAAGFSEYPIVADDDLAKELGEKLAGINIAKHDEINALYIGGKDLVASVISGINLLLPNNLHIWATMNTSDQSLFPIDSAFKRRWNWKYVPIDINPKDIETQQPLNWKFEVAGNQYSWGRFLEIVNPEIYDITESSDKQMGYFFAKADPTTGIISEEVFLNKVMFYLWTDVFKDYDVSNEKFQNKKENRSFHFTDFFEDEEALSNFIENFGLEILNDNSEDYNPGDIEDSNDLSLYNEYQEYWGKVKDFVNNKLGSNIASQAPLKQNWYNIHFGASGIVTFISRNTQTKRLKVGFSISKMSKHFDKFKIEEIKEYIPSSIERTLEKNILIEIAKTDVADFNSKECMDWIADNVKQFYELGKKLISSNK